MILYINSCVRDNSRTDYLARKLLDTLGEYTELDLAKENIKPLDRDTLNKRSSLIAAGDYSDKMFDYAKQFAEADTIVISAPFWDLSFPALLKIYFENIYITGLVSKYSEDGRPIGLCKGSKLYYVSTSGGPFIPDYSYNYVRDLCVGCFGIKDAMCISAEMLDIEGNNPDNILAETVKSFS